VSVRPYRYYQEFITPTGPTAGQTYVVLLYAHWHVRQLDIKARMAKIQIAIEQGWKTKLYLNRDDVRHLAWAVSVMQATELKERSSHPDLVEERRLTSAQLRVNEAMRELSGLAPDSSLLTEFHRKHESSIANVFERLRTATNKYRAARQPIWGLWPRPITAWHRDAIYLMNVLEAAAKRAGKRLSFTKEESPAVQFISQALNRKWVARTLARSRKRSGLSS
jgi:hypothetical protein